MERRRLLKLLGGGAGVLSAAVAVDNVFLGYEALGTNLRKQDLGARFGETFFYGPRPAVVDGIPVELEGATLRVGAEPTTYRYPELTDAEAVEVDREYDLGGLVARGAPALADVRTGPTFEFHDYEAFFDRVAGGEPVPAAVELLRGVRGADPDRVETFASADPARPSDLAEGLAAGFREHASYDYGRYAAGVVTYNVLFDLVDLRESMAHATDFEALLTHDGALGLFCDEFVRRAAEAFHAVPAVDQRAAVVAGSVADTRHRHVFTVLASIIREDGELVIPATFLDYTYATMSDDLNLRGAFGEGLDAYNRHHRADVVYWHEGI